ncbi:restriction endonuclease subunit S [Enterovibrio norvegicus]|uniref:restriction endonuclease subunit S n=1 Tax=Enterovibrio norvegicus TaxID=188144 RepID=UPI0015E2BA0C|nr:restriction endonuclease subunit S [Enterovibrio norvegicus]
MSAVIPEGWLEQPIGNIADVVAGGTPKAGDPNNFAMSGTAIAWLTPADLSKYNSKSISHGARDLSQEGYDSSSAKLMPKGALLFSSRAPIGYVVIAENPICTNQGFKNFVFTEQVDSTYAFYYLKSIRDLAESLGSGTTFKELSGATAKTIPFRLAPLAEQKVIADKLDELLAQVESTKARLDAIPTILKSFRQSVLAAAVSGKLTEEWRGINCTSPISQLLDKVDKLRFDKKSEKFANKPFRADEVTLKIPTEWEWVRLARIAEVVSGVAKGSKSNDELIELPYLRVANVQRGYLNLNEIKHISVSANKAENLYLKNDDILFNEGGDIDKLGRGWIWEGQVKNCIHQNHVFRARTYLENIQSKYISHYGNSEGKEYFLREGTQSVNLANINKTTLSLLPIPLPPVEEQTEIVRCVEELFAFADKVEAQVNTAQARVNNLTQSILAKAFRGELTADWRAANPSLITGDNSAKALLERIKAEREALALAAKAAKKKPRAKKTKAKKIVAKESLNTSINRNLSPVQSVIADGVAHNPQDIFNKLTPDLSLTEVFNEISELLRDNKIEEKTVDGIKGFFIK